MGSKRTLFHGVEVTGTEVLNLVGFVGDRRVMLAQEVFAIVVTIRSPDHDVDVIVERDLRIGHQVAYSDRQLMIEFD